MITFFWGEKDTGSTGEEKSTTTDDMAAESITPSIATLNQLTVREIKTVLKAAQLSISREQRGTKAQLVEYVMNGAPSHILNELLQQAGAKKKRIRDVDEEDEGGSKRARQELQADGTEAVDINSCEDEGGIPDGFLRPPTQRTREECYARFYQATSNAAVEVCVCAVCGRCHALNWFSAVNMDKDSRRT